MSRIASAHLQSLLNALSRDVEVNVSGLRGAALAFVIAAIARDRKRPLLVVTPRPEDAEQLVSDLTFFLVRSSDTSPTRVLHYPAWDITPYDLMSPHSDLALERLGALHALRGRGQSLVLVTSGEALLKRVIPPGVLSQYTRLLKVDDDVDRDALVRRLVEAGYLSTDVVEDAGCLSVRGGILDLFPPLHDYPVRIEFFGDTIDSIREFDPVSQRSIRSLKTLELLPVREEILAEAFVANASSRLKELADALDRPSHLRRQVVEDMGQGIYFPGIEYYLGMLYPDLATLTDYLPDDAKVVVIEPDQLRTELSAYREKVERHFETMDQRDRMVPPPETLFLPPEAVYQAIAQRPRLMVTDRLDTVPSGEDRFQLKIEPTAGLRQTVVAHTEEGGMLKPLVDRLAAWRKDDVAVFIACHTPVQAQRLRDLLDPYGVKVPEPLTRLSLQDLLNPPFPDRVAPIPLIGELSNGFRFSDGRLALLSEEDIFGPKIKAAPTVTKQFLKNAVSSFSQLNRGDPVVHATHGVGLFRGLVKLSLTPGGPENDFLHLEYEGGDKLYLPVHRLNTLQKYVGQGGGPPKLDKLGGVTFAKTKQKVKASLLKLAHELLGLYAARAVVKGFAFKLDRRQIEEFESSFPYEETPDQLGAIEAVYKDMSVERPMDRLVCGDVGYGKTEVAIRAAYLAVLNGKQVAVLVPTTVLALQHYKSFVARFKDYPINVEMLNRFRTATEQRKVLQALKEGKVDVVVGTHRLLSTDVEFKDLGLLVVDEEHRFGVSHKERIKRMRKHLDVLTMTATPIPRTLYMSLSGLREFSLITTPPRDRLAIRTYHVPFSPSQIQEAIRFELRRGGQVFFIHNRVQSIFAMAKFLQKIVPEAKIGVAHGQMEERELEKVMVEFIERRFDVLCCTSIVESGLDIPSANTIIINRADRFGLAQLYQLRGRVGRSTRRAYCYLLTPAGQTLTPVMERRLRTLVNFTELGAGFKIATEDLEMRGAGNLLGSSQSGSINAVGFDMYCELLEKSIHEMQGQDVPDEVEPDIDLKTPAYFPEEYIPDLHQRLHYYKQLSDALDEESLYERIEEVEDRFGSLPEPVRNLLDLMCIRIVLRDMRVRSLTHSAGRLQIRFDDSSLINRDRLVQMISRDPRRYRLTPDQRLLVALEEEEVQNLVRTVKNLLHRVK